MRIARLPSRRGASESTPTPIQSKAIPIVMQDDAPFREVLTWDFEDYGPTGGTLALRWGTHRFPFEQTAEAFRVTREAGHSVKAVVLVDPDQS